MKPEKLRTEETIPAHGGRIACTDCDLLYDQQALQPKEVARCARCGAVLYQSAEANIHQMLALAIAALVLFIIANIDPIMSMRILGESSRCTIIGSVQVFARGGYWELSVLVLLLAILLPLVKLVLLIYILAPLQVHRTVPGMAPAMALYQRIDEWGMLDIFMLGILVALTKISDIAHVELGAGLAAFVGLFITTVTISVNLDPHAIWKRIS